MQAEVEPEQVARARNGDVTAFEALVEARVGSMTRTAMAILGREDEARDAVQDALVTAWRELASLRDPGAFDAWLTRILVNRCRRGLRRIGMRARARDPGRRGRRCRRARVGRRRGWRRRPPGPGARLRPAVDRRANDPRPPPPRRAPAGVDRRGPEDPRGHREVAPVPRPSLAGAGARPRGRAMTGQPTDDELREMLGVAGVPGLARHGARGDGGPPGGDARHAGCPRRVRGAAGRDLGPRRAPAGEHRGGRARGRARRRGRGWPADDADRRARRARQPAPTSPRASRPSPSRGQTATSSRPRSCRESGREPTSRRPSPHGPSSARSWSSTARSRRACAIRVVRASLTSTGSRACRSSSRTRRRLPRRSSGRGARRRCGSAPTAASTTSARSTRTPSGR